MLFLNLKPVLIIILSSTSSEEKEAFAENIDLPIEEEPPIDNTNLLDPADVEEIKIQESSRPLWKKDVKQLLLPSQHNPDRQVLQFVVKARFLNYSSVS